MAMLTDPPDLATRAGDDVLWREAAVFGGVPLAGELGIVAGEVVVSREQGAIGANRAVGADDAGFHLSAPLVPVRTAPPHTLVAAGQELLWREIAIFCRVPLARKLGIECGKVVFTGDGLAACAVGTACAAAGAAVDGGLPVVAFLAAPPHAPLAAARDGLRCERQVACAVPFGKQVFALFAMAEIGERFSHRHHLLKNKSTVNNINILFTVLSGDCR